MTLSEHEYSNDGDSKLLRLIKAREWADASSLLPQEADRPDEFGNLPLHAAIGYQAPDAVILKVLQSYPGATRVHGTDEWLPLHVAAMYGCSERVMEELIRANPDALDDRGQASSIKGRTPRHFLSRFEHNRHLLSRPTEEWKTIIETSNC